MSQKQRQITQAVLAGDRVAGRPAAHPFRVAWSGQPSLDSRSRSSSGSLRLGRSSSLSSGDAQAPVKKGALGGLLCLSTVWLPLAGSVGVFLAAQRALDPDPCSGLAAEPLESVSVPRAGRGWPRGGGIVDVPLPEFHLEAFRALVEPMFEVRRGASPMEVNFRPRLARVAEPPLRSWTRGRLVSALAEPRLGRQRFSIAETPESCLRGEESLAGHLLIFGAFQRTYGEGESLSRVGRWWLKDGGAFQNRTLKGPLGLAVREGFLASDPASDAASVRHQLLDAWRDASRFPKAP